MISLIKWFTFTWKWFQTSLILFIWID